MPGNYSRYIPLISLLGDFVILNILFVAGFCYYQDDGSCFTPRYLFFYLFLNLAWLILAFIFGAHKTDRNTNKKSILFAYINIIVFFFFLFLLYFQVTSLPYYQRSFIKFLFPLFFSVLIAWKFILYYIFYFYRRSGFNFRNVIIVGYNPAALDLQRYFQNNKWHGYRFLGFFTGEGEDAPGILGQWSDLKPFMESSQVDEIYIALNTIPPAIIPEITEILSGYPVKIRILPDLGSFAYKSAELIPYGSIPVLQIHPGPLSYWYNRLVKRVFDIFFSVIALLFVVSWMSLLLYLLSRFNSRDGIFFKQIRTGSDGREFTCIKFRTMKKNPDADLKQATLSDERITKTGRILRKYSLDELPQFLNVLIGDMSAVGPRPHMLAHTEQYRKIAKRFMLRHTVKPGITGLAQVNGYRGEIKDESDIRNRVAFDVQYIETWSFNLDIKIILLTIWVIFRGQREAY